MEQLGKVRVQSESHFTALFWAFIRTIFTVRIPVTLPSIGTHWPLLHTKSDSAHVFFTTEVGFAGLKLKSLTQEPYIPIRGTTAFEILF